MNSLVLAALLQILIPILSGGLIFYVSTMVNRLSSHLRTVLASRNYPREDLVTLRTVLVALSILSVLTLLIGIYLYYQLYSADTIVSALDDLLSTLMTQ